VSAGSKRGVAKVELVLNGFKWAEAKGATFGTNGQPNPSNYSIQVPSNLPGGVVDVVARACDDIGRCADSPVVTVMKGAPCADASSCLAGQKCEAGKCFWDQPVGEVGDDCTYPQYCKTLNGQGPDETSKVCTTGCVPGATDSCPDGLECIATGPASGICYTAQEGGGCCSVGHDDDSPAPWLWQGGLSMLLLGLMLRRRKK
jgi:MYXO-CTERM domain-containing protein